MKPSVTVPIIVPDADQHMRIDNVMHIQVECSFSTICVQQVNQPGPRSPIPLSLHRVLICQCIELTHSGPVPIRWEALAKS